MECHASVTLDFIGMGFNVNYVIQLVAHAQGLTIISVSLVQMSHSILEMGHVLKTLSVLKVSIKKEPHALPAQPTAQIVFHKAHASHALMDSRWSQ